MKKLLRSIVLMAMICASALVATITAGPAGADTTCTTRTIAGPLPGSSDDTHVRDCASDVTVGGARFKGHIQWYYDGTPHGPAPAGQLTGTIYDLATDGYCAQVWVKHYTATGTQNDSRLVQQACDGGRGWNPMPDTGTQWFNVFNPTNDRYSGGTWKVFIVCHDASGRVFQQDVTAGP